jgi:hypothetical protein
VRQASQAPEAFADYAFPVGDIVDQLFQHAQSAGASAVVDGLGHVDSP